MNQPLDECHAEFEKFFNEVCEDWNQECKEVRAIQFEAFQAAYNLHNPNPASEGDVGRMEKICLVGEKGNSAPGQLWCKKDENGYWLLNYWPTKYVTDIYPEYEVFETAYICSLPSAAMPQPAGNGEVKHLIELADDALQFIDESTEVITDKNDILLRQLILDLRNALNNTNTGDK